MNGPEYRVRCLACGKEAIRSHQAKRCQCGGSLERLEGPSTDAQRIRDLEAQLSAANTKLETAEASAAAVREALERCQVVFATIGNYVSLGGVYDLIHATREQSEAALASDAGATLLAQMAAMRAALEDTLRDVPPEVWDALYSTRWHESPIMVALAPDAGKALLARLERAAAVVAAAGAYRDACGAHSTGDADELCKGRAQMAAYRVLVAALEAT